MLVDAAIEVLRIPLSDIEATEEYLGCVGKVKNRLIFLLDLEQVLTKKEIEKFKYVCYK
ncbi:hypothetical protein C5S32_04070 [ANME-1 cluster archaeon GoMg1]|nr:hypothetical protein [ANME-1 cluster archaeon GoMg1]